MKQIYQEWLESSSIDKDHHLLYLETRPPLRQSKKTLRSVADESHHPLIMILLASPLSLCTCAVSHPSPQTLVP